VDRLRPAAQNNCIARLQTERGRIDGHVRAALIDDPDDTERHADLGDLQAVRTAPPGEHISHRVRKRGDLCQPLAHGIDPFVIEPEAIEHVRGDAFIPCQ
jgi:hypothetical protein